MNKTLAYVKAHKIISALILLIVVGLGYFIYTKAHPAQATVRYVTAAVTTGTITSSVSGTGQVVAAGQLNVTPQGSGIITAIDVKQGQQVKAGQVLATIDEQSAINTLNSAKAALASAQAAYDSLMAGDTPQDLQLGQLSVQSAQQALNNAKTNLTQVTAQQALAVAKAFSSLLNDSLQAQASDSITTATAAVSGNYATTTEGSYTITLYSGGDGLHYSSSGLGNAFGILTRGVPLPIGNGLYVNFSSSGTISQETVWTIQVPNQAGSSYLNDLSAYNSALQNQTQALNQAQQQIDSAQTALQTAQTQLDQKQAPPTQAQIESAKAQLQSAQVQVANAQTTYDNNIIRAPFDGVVAASSLIVGQQASSATTIATIVTQKQEADVTLNEVDAAKVAVGQKVTLSFPALPDLSLTGQVGEVDTIGTVTQNVVNYTIKIFFDTQDARVKPGMSVSADVITQVKQDVLMVPSAAVKTSSGGQSYVQVLVNGTPVQQTVITGISSNTQTEVSGSINEGDQVVTQTISGTAAKTATTATAGSILGGLGGGAVRIGGAGFTGGGAARGN